MVKKKFKLCPYCGEIKCLYENEFLIAPVAGKGGDDYAEHRVECLNCGALGPWADTRAGAIEAWNKREENVMNAIKILKNSKVTSHLSYEKMAQKIGVSSRTLYRWLKEVSGE